MKIHKILFCMSIGMLHVATFAAQYTSDEVKQKLAPYTTNPQIIAEVASQSRANVDEIIRLISIPEERARIARNESMLMNRVQGLQGLLYYVSVPQTAQARREREKQILHEFNQWLSETTMSDNIRNIVTGLRAICKSLPLKTMEELNLRKQKIVQELSNPEIDTKTVIVELNKIAEGVHLPGDTKEKTQRLIDSLDTIKKLKNATAQMPTFLTMVEQIIESADNYFWANVALNIINSQHNQAYLIIFGDNALRSNVISELTNLSKENCTEIAGMVLDFLNDFKIDSQSVASLEQLLKTWRSESDSMKLQVPTLIKAIEDYALAQIAKKKADVLVPDLLTSQEQREREKKLLQSISEWLSQTTMSGEIKEIMEGLRTICVPLPLKTMEALNQQKEALVRELSRPGIDLKTIFAAQQSISENIYSQNSREIKTKNLQDALDAIKKLNNANTPIPVFLAMMTQIIEDAQDNFATKDILVIFRSTHYGQAFANLFEDDELRLAIARELMNLSAKDRTVITDSLFVLLSSIHGDNGSVWKEKMLGEWKAKLRFLELRIPALIKTIEGYALAQIAEDKKQESQQKGRKAQEEQ